MKLFRTLLLGASALALSLPAYAGPVIATTTPAPTPGGEIGARIRWGSSGFEASLFDANPLDQSPQLNPAGAPVWQVNTAYAFQVDFDSATGVLGLKVDFDNSGTFAAGETITRSTFAAPSLTSYLGKGFNYLSISGNESGSTARSTVTNLAINGTAMNSITPNGIFLESFYKDQLDVPMTAISISGKLTFTTSGTGQERPSWNFTFRGAADPVSTPDGGVTASLLGLALAGLGIARRTFVA